MPSTLTDLQVPSIKQVDAEAAPVAVIMAALIASVAGSDGIITPREYAAGLGAAEAMAGLSDDPAVVRSLTLRALDVAPKPLDVVLKEVAGSRSSLPEQARRPLLEALFPLLATQGDQARPLARKVAEALDIKNVDAVLNAGGLPPEGGGVTALLRRAGHALSRGSGKLDVAGEVAHFTGDEELTRLLLADRQERDKHLDAALAIAFERLRATLLALHQAHEDHGEKLEVAHSMDRNADGLEQQFKARLRAVEKRVMLLRQHVKEDVEALSEDGGEEAEVDLRRMSERRGLLLRNDDRDVRERMVTKTPFEKAD